MYGPLRPEAGAVLYYEEAERLLEAWENAHPELGPVLSYDTRHGVAGITVSLPAAGINDAVTDAIAHHGRGIGHDDMFGYGLVGHSVIPCRLDD
jgi:hypothetical protein